MKSCNRLVANDMVKHEAGASVTKIYTLYNCIDIQQLPYISVHNA